MLFFFFFCFVGFLFFFFFNDTATTEIYTLSLHDALRSIGVFINFEGLVSIMLVCTGFSVTCKSNVSGFIK